MELIIALALGFILGLLTKGITITHKQAEPETSQEGYNKSTEDLLPPEIRNHLDQTNGYLNY